MEVDIDVAKDLGYATLQRIKKDNLAMTFGTGHYELFNTWFGEKAEKDSGDVIKDYITLKDTGNGKHISMWEDDSHNVLNTDEEITTNWVHYTTNMDYNAIEVAINQDNPVRIYNMLNSKQLNMFREMAEQLQLAAVLSPSSASDKKHPHGLSAWLSMGTDDSSGDWSGYSGRYNDGSGTTYNLGGVASSASVNPRWASYYADHKGQLGDFLLDCLFRATTQTKFIVPIVPKKGKIGEDSGFANFRFYCGIEILQSMEHLLRKSDDRIGVDLGKYNNMIVYKGIPFIYLEELNTARSTLYGTNPLFGVNHDHFKITILKNRDFIIGKPYQRDDNHNVLTVPVDLTYAIHTNNRQRAGFLISQQ